MSAFLDLDFLVIPNDDESSVTESWRDEYEWGGSRDTSVTSLLTTEITSSSSLDENLLLD